VTAVILIVDDNTQNLYLLESILKGYGFTTISAKNGAEALEIAAKNPPDLIITDILMPVMDGFELCRIWKKDEQLQGIPFIFFTATYTDPRDERFALSLGAERYVTKPQKPDILIGIVREVLLNAEKEVRALPETTFEEEMESLRGYNDVLFRKLQKKVKQLEDEVVRCNRIDESLRESESFLQTIFDHIPNMVFVKDALDLRFVRFNKAGEDLIGYPRAELIGKTAGDLFPKEQAAFFIGKDREVLRNKTLQDIPEETIQTRLLGTRILHTKKIPILDESGTPRYLLGISEDITERRRADEQMKLTNRKLELMTEVTYQDIQNKITAVRGYIELSRKSEGEEKWEEFIDKETDILESIHNLIRKTKDYQQMGVNTSSWIPLESMIQFQFSQISQRQKVSLHCDLKGLLINSDPLIERVFYNIMHNAVHHGQTVTTISFTCRETDEGMVLICEDDGVGIPDGEKAHIFDRVIGGRGAFGLFFVREFLNLAGMKITETGLSGKGARFEITIPEGAYQLSGTAGGEA
jgi:PAS domain S-box-containing protein